MRLTRPARAGLAAALLAVTLGLGGCGGSDNADAVRDDGTVDLSKVTLTVGDQKGGSQALLSAAGELDDLPYDVEWKPFTSGPPLLEAVSSGAVDVGGVGNTPPLFAIDQGKKLKVVSAYSQGATGDAILVPKGSSLTDVADLEGKKVAVAKGSSANYNLLAQLDDAGLSFSDVEPVYLQPSEALAAFKGGSVDAWAIWDPFTSQAELDTGATVLSDGKGLVNGLAFQVAGDEALEDKATRAALRDFLGRLAGAQVWAAEHKSEWSRTWAEETGLSTAITDRAVEQRSYTPLPIDDEVIASEQEMWDAFAEQGQLTADPTLSDWFVTDFNDDVEKATSTAEDDA
ncbi:sulfonate transport system substrate-binding protein [Nocardioides scoriae]|uniref:Putative aliphatic sulfonates-binding protein n=1 Tax=Nocardioides scoriae TaxID=642780 RepID=A0A1H1N3Y9_9ACTN|nr:ABC transporter substrate-binding protein [Nocardioides scoriae]SDR93610.1 sulfonate transport system substrate-binding protein [Nocardioides scoriae]